MHGIGLFHLQIGIGKIGAIDLNVENCFLSFFFFQFLRANEEIC